MTCLPRLATVRWRALAPLTAVVLCVAGSNLQAQPPARTADHHPDLQGMWLNNTATPLERPKDFAGKAIVTDADAREYEKRYQLDRTAAISPVDPVFELQAAGDLDTYEPGRLLPGNRTSMITNPADGRVPALTPAAQQRLAVQTDRVKTHYGENPENFPNTERCLMMGNSSSPPMLPVFYNNNVQIVQTRDYVVIVSEMIHDARIVPLDGRPHLPAARVGRVGRPFDRTIGTATRSSSRRPTSPTRRRCAVPDPDCTWWNA